MNALSGSILINVIACRCSEDRPRGGQPITGKALAAADPEVPTALHDRQADNWRPLLAIADLAGGDWPARARAAARADAPDADADDAAGIELLADIERIFAVVSADHLLHRPG